MSLRQWTRKVCCDDVLYFGSRALTAADVDRYCPVSCVILLNSPSNTAWEFDAFLQHFFWHRRGEWLKGASATEPPTTRPQWPCLFLCADGAYTPLRRHYVERCGGGSFDELCDAVIGDMDSLDTTAEGGEDARHSFEQVPLSPTVSTIPNSVLEALYSRLVPSTDDTKAQVNHTAPLLLPVACQLTTDFEKCLQLVEQLQRRHSSAFPHLGTDQPELETEMDPEAGKAIQVGAPLLQRCREAVLESLSASVTDRTTADSHTQEVVSLEEQRLQTLLGSLNTPDAPNSGGQSLRTVVLPTIVVFGAYGGRLDHEMAALNCVLKFATMYHILLTNSENVTFACWPDGVTQFVRSPAADIMTPPTCGLIPMGRVHELETTGFRWNMVVGRSSSYDGFTQTSSYNFDFDALVSSCNVMDQPLITVDLRPLHMEPSPPAAPQRAARINPPTFFTYSRRCA